MIEKSVALVTGAARGIGYAIARRLSADGSAVVVVDIADEKNKIKELGESCIFIKGDITSSESRRMVLEIIIKEYGRLDILINNAGVAPKTRLDILETTEESMDFVLGVNLKGTFFLTQLVSKYMIQEISDGMDIKPIIINISSISANTSSPSRGEYCISKAGVSMITSLFADRLAEYGINVYEIRPGIILTDMTSVVKEKYDKLIGEGLVPFKKWGYPKDIANSVGALCSGDFSFSTGEIIYVDGGLHIQRL